MIRLKVLESLVLLSLYLLLIPKVCEIAHVIIVLIMVNVFLQCILSFVNYGIVHDIVSIISSGLEAQHNKVHEVNQFTSLLWGIESTLIQMLDMMVSSKGTIDT